VDRPCQYCYNAESKAEWETKYGVSTKEFCSKQCRELYCFCLGGIKFEDFYKLAKQIASNFQRLHETRLDIDDLAQSALLYLMEKKSDFDASKGTFKKFANFCLFHKIFELVEKQLRREKLLKQQYGSQ